MNTSTELSSDDASPSVTCAASFTSILRSSPLDTATQNSPMMELGEVRCPDNVDAAVAKEPTSRILETVSRREAQMISDQGSTSATLQDDQQREDSVNRVSVKDWQAPSVRLLAPCAFMRHLQCRSRDPPAKRWRPHF